MYSLLLPHALQLQAAPIPPTTPWSPGALTVRRAVFTLQHRDS